MHGPYTAQQIQCGLNDKCIAQFFKVLLVFVQVIPYFREEAQL